MIVLTGSRRSLSGLRSCWTGLLKTGKSGAPRAGGPAREAKAETGLSGFPENQKLRERACEKVSCARSPFGLVRGPVGAFGQSLPSLSSEVTHVLASGG